jgi:hypothetical protein
MTDEIYIGGCADLRAAMGVDGGCCTSCHDDADNYVYDLCEIKSCDGGYYSVCCDVNIDYEQWTHPAAEALEPLANQLRPHLQRAFGTTPDESEEPHND